jgi:hypothetical protein
MSSCVATILVAALLPIAAAQPAPPAWRQLAAGLEYAQVGDMHVVRVDPGRAPLGAVMASADDLRPRTAAAWCRRRGLLVAINLGMYQDDHLSNVGHAHAGGQVNNARWAGKYRSALAFGPTKPGSPVAVLLDLDVAGARDRLADYGTVVQNLRLVRTPGINVWTAQPRRWSEAAVAADRRGRILFVFSRAPHTMSDFNRQLLAAPLDVQAAMHVEGGPEASLSIHAGGVNVDLNGSYETGFNENDAESSQWPIPNVLGVVAPAQGSK